MNSLSGMQLFWVFVAATLAAILVYLLLLRLSDRRMRAGVVGADGPPQMLPTFLFDGPDLIHATTGARQLIASRQRGVSEKAALLDLLRNDFPDLRQRMENLSPDQQAVISPMNGSPLVARISRDGGLTRVALSAADGHDVDVQYAALARASHDAELNMLRDLTENAPQAIWREDRHGRVIWANRAYLALADRLSDPEDDDLRVWPSTRLFDGLPIGRATGSALPDQRLSLPMPGAEGEHWFDIRAQPQEDGHIFYASDANPVVQAENAKREFMQTIGKTFAQLAIGLAIFNRKRQLTMFNPALLDMTGLSFSFLSGRPTLDLVLDRMREMRKLPEPKDYSSWRDSFKTLESEAQEGTYAEHWDLPDGQTFRVIGRPHPDGALAFLFEDISAEVSLTRHFRTEIETSQAVLDSIPDAVAVFSNAHALVMSNRAYRSLWKVNEEDVLATMDLRAAMRRWKAASAPSPIWARLDAFAKDIGTREEWTDQVTLLDGRQAKCTAVPLAGRMTMVRFKLDTAAAAGLKPVLTRSDPAQQVDQGSR